MRVIVCGGRDYDNEAFVFECLDQLPIEAIIQGGARGADTLALRWGKQRLPPDCRLEFLAKWDKYGRGAGHIRNQQMLDEGKPDLVVAFSGGKGTENMVSRARKAGVPVWQPDIEPFSRLNNLEAGNE